MFERQILGICIGGFNGADSSFGENGENQLNTKGPTLMPSPLSAFLFFASFSMENNINSTFPSVEDGVENGIPCGRKDEPISAASK